MNYAAEKKSKNGIRLRTCLRSLFHFVSRKRAVRIAKKATLEHMGEWRICDAEAVGLHIYGVDRTGCWCVYVPTSRSVQLISSSHIVLISKFNGRIVYNGSAQDEG